MKLNKIQLMAVNISKVLKNILNDRISSSKIYDLVDEPNHHSFKIGFTAYNYFYVVFHLLYCSCIFSTILVLASK